MNHKILSSLVISSILLSSCGKKSGSGVVATPAPVPEVKLAPKALVYEKNETLESWKELILEDRVPYSVAEAISGMVSEKDRKNIERYLKDYTPEELADLIKQIRRQEERSRKELLFGSSEFQHDGRFLKSLLVKRASVLYNPSESIESTIKLSVAIREKNKYLTRITETYTKRIREISRQAAANVARQLQREQEEELASIKAEIKQGRRKEETLERLADLVLKADEFQLYLSTRSSEQVAAEVLDAAAKTMASYLAEVIYEELQRSGSLKRLLTLAQEVQKVQRQIDEALVLVVALESHFKNVGTRITGLYNSVQDVKMASIVTIEALKDKKFRSDVLYPAVLDYAADRILNHSRVGEEFKTTVGKAERITNGVNSIVDTSRNLSNSASGLLNDFSTILHTTEALSKTLGITFPKGVSKIIGDVQRVNELVQGGQSVISGLMAAGPVGGLMALSTGPGAKLLSGAASVPSFEDNVMKELGVINAKLDVIIENQAEMMRMQQETMKMVHDLAMMIDEQHYETLSKLNDIHYDIKLSMENDRLQKLRPIKDCEGMIMGQLGLKVREHANPIVGMDASVAQSLARQLRESLPNQKAVLNFIKSTSALNFESCRQELSRAFANFTTTEEATLRKLSRGASDVNSLYLEKFLYAPLYGFLGKKGEKIPFEKGIHLPFATVNDIDVKHRYVSSPGPLTGEALDLEHLLSAETLVRYASNLLVLYPYLEFERSDWEKGIESLLGAVSESARGGESHSQRFLKGALHQTQIAIAQEAILAGEPIFDRIAPVLQRTFSSKIVKVKVKKDVFEEFQQVDDREAALRMNKILLRNFVVYTVTGKNKNSPHSDLRAYEMSYPSDLNSLNRILFGSKAPGLLYSKGGKVFLKNRFIRDGSEKSFNDVELPTPDEVEQGRILYSPNMARLLSLQEKLLDALVKNSGDLTVDGKLMLANILMGRNYEPKLSGEKE